METLHVLSESDKFDQIVKENALVVVYFAAKWCKPCQKISPKIETLAESNGKAYFVKVDVNDCDDLASSYDVSSVPLFKFFKNGEELKELEIAGANFSGASKSTAALCE